jgi:hypothetical protein
MDAPTYPPATAYEPPSVAPYELTVRNLPVAEISAIPAAWAIVVKHMPGMKFVTSTSLAKPHLGNMTVADFAGFMGQSNSPALAEIDAELSQLPASQKAGR